MRSLPLVLALAAAGCALLFGRSTVDGARTGGPVRVDGRDDEWTNVPAYEDAGLSVQAMTGDADLYLLISAASREGRAQLEGRVGQPFTLWFVAADGRTRTWGVRLPFDAHWTTAEDPGPEPEYVVATGPKVSTAPWPSDVEFRYDISGRRPVYEARVPFSRAPRAPDGAIPLDVVVSGHASRPPGYRPVGDEGRSDPWVVGAGPRAQRSRYASGPGPRLDEIPQPLEMFLKVRPAAAPPR